MRTSTGRPTKIEAARIGRFRHIGCAACNLLGRFNTQFEIHHLLSGGRRRGHLFTIPLCPYHHRGVGSMPGEPSLAKTPKAFRERYGDDETLLARVNALIGH